MLTGIIQKYVFLGGMLLAGAIHHSYGQINSWNHYLYTTKDGLPSNTIRNVVEDHDGFIWVATESGLCRFDGDEFVMVMHDSKDSTTIPSDFINDVNILPDGRLLVSTTNGLYVMNTRTMRGKTFHFYTRKGWETYDDYIHNIYINKQLHKVVVLSSTAFIYFDFDLTHMEVIPYRFPSDDVNEGGNLTNYKPLFLPDGDALFMDNYSGELSLVDFQKKEIMPLKAVPSNPYYALSAHSQYDCSSIDYAGNVWVHCVGIDSLFCCVPDHQLIAYPLKGNFRNVNWIQQISFPGDNRMIWGFFEKEKYELYELPYADLISHPGSQVTMNSHSGFGARVYEMYIDKVKNWWVASMEGLYLVKKNHQAFQKIDLPLPYRKDGDWQYIMDMERVDEDNLLIASNYEHCYLYNLKDNTLISYLDTVSIEHTGLYRMDEIFNTDSDRHLILGRQDLTFQNKQLKMGFQPVLPWEEHFKKYSTSAIFKDSKGNTWVSFNNYGLIEWNVSEQFCHYFKPGTNFFSDSFSAITEDKDGNIWFVSFLQSNLSKFNIATGKFENFILKDKTNSYYKWVSTMVAGDNGWLYLGSLNGIILFNTIDKTVKEISMKDGLPSNRILGLFYVDKYLFISTLNGLVVMNTGNYSMKTLKQVDGIFENVSTKAFYLDKSNHTLYVGGKGCVYKIHLKTLFESKNQVNVILENCKINDQAIHFENKKLQFHSTENNLSFSVSSIDFYSGINKKYFYRIMLNGKASEWISNHNNKQFSFINLSPGDYTIEVRSKNADNAWSVNTASISFVILKPWYNQWWFYTLCLLAAGLILRGIYTYRVYQIRHVERIRAKLSRDLHDDIGSTLSSINILSRMATRNAAEIRDDKTIDTLEKINERSQRLLDNMSDIVWSIKPENDALEEMLSRMRQYATGMLESKGIDYTVDFPTEKLDYKLPLEVKNNLYLIFKEAVNNLCKYAQCGNVVLAIRFENKTFTMTIQDDGIGFDKNAPASSNGGNGLKNMRQRAAEIGAELVIESKPGKGTTVSLSYRP